MRKLVLRLVINAVAVWAAIVMVRGITADGGFAVSIWVGLILGVVNALIAPIVKLLTCPLILVSLGLFTLVINALMLRLVSAIAVSAGLGFHVDGFGPAFFGGLVISIVSFVLSVVTGAHRDERNDRDRRGS